MKQLIIAIIKFLQERIDTGSLTPDAAEGIEVAIQCIEAAFQISQEDLRVSPTPLLEIFTRYRMEVDPAAITNEQREEAENLKLVGNSLMREGRFEEAIEIYSRAIAIDPNNAVYYCNRAAAHIKMAAYSAAIDDCNSALQLDPRYSKAHSRLGFAHSAMGNNLQAKICYQRALSVEPDNESYRASLQNVEEQLSAPGAGNYADISGLLPGIDLSGLLRNPGFVNMAGQMLADPGMQNVVSRLLSSQQFPLGNVEDLISVGQQLADRLQQGGSPRNLQNNSAREDGSQHDFPDLLRPQENEAVPVAQDQEADPQQQEIGPDVVQQAIEDLPPAALPIHPENRNIHALDHAPPPVLPARPLEDQPQPPVEEGLIGDGPNLQGLPVVQPVLPQEIDVGAARVVGVPQNVDLRGGGDPGAGQR